MEELSAVDYLIEILLTRGNFDKTDPISPLTSTKPDCNEQFEGKDKEFIEQDDKSRSVKFNDIVTLVTYEDLTEELVPIKNDSKGKLLKRNKKENVLKRFRRFCRKISRRFLFKMKKDKKVDLIIGR